jgi:hypothetical protein
MYFFFQAWAAQDAAQEDIGFRWRVVVLLAGVLLIIFAFLLPDDEEKKNAKAPSD